MAGFAALSSGALGASAAAEKPKQPEFVKLESGLSYQDKVKRSGALVNLEQSVAAVSPPSSTQAHNTTTRHPYPAILDHVGEGAMSIHADVVKKKIVVWSGLLPYVNILASFFSCYFSGRRGDASRFVVSSRTYYDAYRQGDLVIVDYIAYLRDGTIFDNTVKRGKPVAFQVSLSLCVCVCVCVRACVRVCVCA
jgi:hypothetical protein